MILVEKDVDRDIRRYNCDFIKKILIYINFLQFDQKYFTIPI